MPGRGAVKAVTVPVAKALSGHPPARRQQVKLRAPGPVVARVRPPPAAASEHLTVVAGGEGADLVDTFGGVQSSGVAVLGGVKRDGWLCAVAARSFGSVEG